MVGNERLLLMPRKTLLTTRFVCPLHFEDNMFWDKFKNRLHRFAIPSLSTPPPLTDSIMAGFDNPFALLQCPSTNNIAPLNFPVSAAHSSLTALLNVPLISPAQSSSVNMPAPPQSSSSPPNLFLSVPPSPSVNIPPPPPPSPPLQPSSTYPSASGKSPGK